MKSFLGILITLISTQCIISSLTLNINVDTEDFKNLLINNDLFVDKSLLIDNLLTRSDTTLILQPNGWGKSTNMDMIRRFFEIEIDELGSRLPKERTINDKLFLGGTLPTGSNKSKLLEPLKIANSSDTIRHHLGKYPVIILKLKNTMGNSYEEIVGKIRSSVTNAFRDHDYLLNSSRITKCEQLRRYLTGEFDDKSLHNSLSFLSEKLHEHFDQQVVILIDDYETPVMNAYTLHGLSKKPSRPFHFHVEGLLFEIYNAAFRPFRNPWVKLGLLVGEHLIPVDNDECLLSSVSIFRPQYESEFCEFYGFTNAEVQKLLSKIHELESYSKEIKNWYNGYEYGGQQIYSSRSTMMYLARNSRSLKSFASDIHNDDGIGYIDRILTSDLIQKRIQTLVSEDSDFTYRTLGKYINMDHKSDLCSKEDQTRLLIDKGYLALDREPPNDILWRLYIPNNEMKHIFETKILHWVFVKFATDNSSFRTFAGSLKSGNAKLFADTLQLYHDKAAKYLETDDNLVVLYNGLITALQITLSRTHIVIRNKNHWDDWRFGEGHDVHIIPKFNSSNVAILMKCEVDQKENLQSAVNEGLNQIDVNLYIDEWRNYRHNIRNMVKISIAVCGEQLAVEYETVKY